MADKGHASAGQSVPEIVRRHARAGVHGGLPSIPGVRYVGKSNDVAVTDFLARPARHTNGVYRTLVLKVDKDGNDVAGARSWLLQAPLGTYPGWNLRRAGFIENEGCSTNGSYIPFARTAAERNANNDPRLSLEERYKTHDAWVAQVRAATQRLQQQRLLLPQDAERVIRNAQQRKLGLPGGPARTE